jgi:hypothetical protein
VIDVCFIFVLRTLSRNVFHSRQTLVLRAANCHLRVHGNRCYPWHLLGDFYKMKTIVKFIAGVAAVLLTLWGIGSIYNALAVPYVSWLQGVVGFVFLLGALTIYLVWFRRR